MAPRVLVVGSLNVDLFQTTDGSSIKLGGKPIDIAAVKGMTLPAKSFVENPAIASQLKAAGLQCAAGEEEGLVLSMDGPFEQATGGKGANAAAAAGQSFRAELICNFGKQSESENKLLSADLKKFGNVDTRRSGLVEGPTGTAYIMNYADGDNAIMLLGGANQNGWAASGAVVEEGGKLHKAIEESVAVMLQREVPDYVNLEVAKAARSLGKPVVMDVGGSDAALDVNLLPLITEIAPNESELTFISGKETKVGDEVKKDLLREAVAALKAKFAAAGNNDVEVLVTLGKHGSAHFGSQWTKSATEDLMGLLPHENQMGVFKLGTESGKPQDTTGAGDCFRGSYVAARYGQGKEVAEAMQWASAAGSVSVEVQGAMPSMPKRGAIAARAKKESSSGLFASGAVEMKVSLKKPKPFYVQAALSFLKGVEAKPAAEGKDAVEAKPAVDALRISGLGEACGVAVAAAAQVEAENAGTIVSIKTAYPRAGGYKGCAQIVIDIRRK